MNPTPILPNIYGLGYRTGKAVSNLIHPESISDADAACHWRQLPPAGEMVTAVINFPVWYKEWWWNLYKNDPLHVFVETTLLCAIVYILISSRRRRAESISTKLTDHEVQELLQEWKEHGRQPLAPQKKHALFLQSVQENAVLQDNGTHQRSTVIVHKSNGREMEIEDTATMQRGERKSVLNFAAFDFLGMQADTLPALEKKPAKKKKKSKASAAVVSPTSATDPSLAIHPVKEASLAALDRYGCGSCGPRGFYGTIDVHLQLEKAVADFTGTDDAILYSDGASTVTSTIAAFCKRGDLLIVDEAVYEPIRTGVVLSRANVKWFAHNDMNDLRRVLTQVQESDKKLGRKLNAQRRFLVVEGLYKNTGNICPLNEIVKLKHEFKYRLIMDESFSFGTLGATGRGLTELYQQKMMHDVEIVVVSLENAMGSVGAMTIGTEEVVDHQRLSGSGYCFSASSPPFTATAAIAALELLESKPELTVQCLNDNREYLYQNLQKLLHDKLEDLLLITSDERSPIVLLQVADIPETEYLDEAVFLQEVVRESLARGVAFVASGASQLPKRVTDPPPGIRITVSAAHKRADIDKALDVLGEAVDVIMSRFHDEEDVE
jgi:serine palmitoyltransferase